MKQIDTIARDFEDDLPHPAAKRRNAETDPYSCRQMDLFQTFICNTSEERDRLSNAIDLWDSVPRYSVSRQEMTKRRDQNGHLPSLSIPFKYLGRSYIAAIEPARVKEGDRVIEYYPSANEELVEDALRKLAVVQSQGFYEQGKGRSGVSFSLYELMKELSMRGHTRSYQQIVQSLTILRKSHIELRGGEGGGESLISATYLPQLAAVSRKKLVEDPASRWVATFHPLVTESIDRLQYRQYNYAQMMAHTTQLARWLHKQLSLKFTFAGFAAKPFEMRYTTIKRDSSLLNRSREIDNRRDVDEGFESLVRSNVLRSFDKSTTTASRGRITEVVYFLHPSHDFVKAMKAANKRSNDLAEAGAAQQAL